MKSNIVKDCIYGFVKIPDLCRSYMDTPEFQRLRRVKQLGSVSRVYPSATHTRFEHSIGVMHLAGELADVLNISTEHKILIQLAGLYHDIGHLPYSHLFDKVLKMYKPEGVLLDHEDRSIDTFLKVSKRLGIVSQKDQEFVSACIKGEYLEGYDKCLFQVVSSYIDVDKLDYLCRDAYHTGMPTFQSSYIIQNARLNENREIVFRKKALEDIKDMFETRRRMHELVYQHPVSLEYDTLYMCMILKVSHVLGTENLEYYSLCDYKLETLLMENRQTKDMYQHIEARNKNHSLLCSDVTHSIISKNIFDSGCLSDVQWSE